MKNRISFIAASVAGTTLLLSLSALHAQDKSHRREGQQGHPVVTHAYFGDLHLHTGYSFDVHNFTNLMVGTEEAYRFARGESVVVGGKEYKRISQPLDFLAVTDHAEWMVVPGTWESPDSPPFMAEIDKLYANAMKADIYQFLELGWPPNPKHPKDADLTPFTRLAWQREVEAANRYYRPGTFTTLLGYEYTSQTIHPDMSLHRTVIFRDGNPPYPFTSIDSKKPEDLWAFLRESNGKQHEGLAIAAHPGLDMNPVFDWKDSDGQPINSSEATLREENEPLIEISQANGQFDTRPDLSPDDEFAAFDLPIDWKKYPGLNVADPAGKYARTALTRGMRIAQMNGGVNPFRFGFVGTSDSHNALSESSERWGDSPGSSPGITGVWAEHNTRESIFAALHRRETFATSGSRMKVTFFGGWNFKGSLVKQHDWESIAYREGVPMGGDLPDKPVNAQAPVFAMWATRDENGANLDRIQVIKVWLKDSRHSEKVYNVALSSGRHVDPQSGQAPAVGNTVDLDLATYTNTIGSATLSAVWRDPDFDPNTPAAYYLRVLEIPTPRGSTIRARAKGEAPPADWPSTIQERGWSSPIWFTPKTKP
jgi:Protein of unknown function (DUF3604)